MNRDNIAMVRLKQNGRDIKSCLDELSALPEFRKFGVWPSCRGIDATTSREFFHRISDFISTNNIDRDPNYLRLAAKWHSSIGDTDHSEISEVKWTIIKDCSGSP